MAAEIAALCYLLLQCISTLLVVAGAVSSHPFRWSYLEPELAKQAGNCSLLVSVADTFQSNFASLAGGALFSTDTASTTIACSTTATPAGNQTCGGPMWSGNAVGIDGYGAQAAFLPASIAVLAGPMDNYVSNGLATLPMTIHVQDQAGGRVTIGRR